MHQAFWSFWISTAYAVLWRHEGAVPLLVQEQGLCPYYSIRKGCALHKGTSKSLVHTMHLAILGTFFAMQKGTAAVS